MSGFRDALLAKQGHMGGRAFARVLSIDPGEWVRIKKGKEPSHNIKLKACRIWPELMKTCYEDFKREVAS